MSNYTKAELAEFIKDLKDISGKATSGPWSYARSDGVLSDEGCYEIYETYEDDPPIIECHNWQIKENAQLICLLRNNCEGLIEILEKELNSGTEV